VVNVNVLVLLVKIEHFVYHFLYINVSWTEIYFQCQRKGHKINYLNIGNWNPWNFIFIYLYKYIIYILMNKNFISIFISLLNKIPILFWNFFMYKKKHTRRIVFISSRWSNNINVCFFFLRCKYFFVYAHNLFAKAEVYLVNVLIFSHSFVYILLFFFQFSINSRQHCMVTR